MQVARIKQFPTSFNSQSFYIDPNFFSLLKRIAHDDNEVFLKELITAIAAEHTDQPELYLDRVINPNDKIYKVLVHDGTCVKPILLDLSHPNNGEKPVINLSDETIYPEELNPFSPRNVTWLAPNLKEGIHRFEQECPAAPMIFSPKHYSIELAAQPFQILQPYADIHKKCLATDNMLCQRLQSYNLLIQSIAEIDDLPSAPGLEKLFDKISTAAYENAKIMNETLNALASVLDDKYANFSNNQEKLRCVKTYLAWAFYITVAHSTGKISTDRFNAHFENVIRIDAEGVTDIYEVRDTFVQWPIEKIENFINKVMSAPYDDSIGWSAEKQKELMKNINDKAEQLKKMLDLNALPCNVYNSRIPFKSPIFTLNEMKKFEAENQTILSKVHAIANSSKYQTVKQLNFGPVEEALTLAETKLAKFKIMVEDYKKIIAQRKKVLAEIDSRTKTLQAWLEKLGVDNDHHLAISHGTTSKEGNTANSLTDLSKPLASIKERIQARILSIKKEAVDVATPLLDEDDFVRIEQLNHNINTYTTIQEKIEMLDNQKSDIEYLINELQTELVVISKEIEDKYPIVELDPLLSKNNRHLGDEFLKYKNNYNAARAEMERYKRKWIDHPAIFNDKLRNSLNEAQKKIANCYQEIQFNYLKMTALIKSSTPTISAPTNSNNNVADIEPPKPAELPIPIKPPVKEVETQTLPATALPLPKPARPVFSKSTDFIPPSQPGFFKRHGKAICVGVVSSLVIGGLSIAVLSQLGLTATVLTAIAAGTAKVASLCGWTFSETTCTLLGFGTVTAGISALGGALGVWGSKPSKSVPGQPSLDPRLEDLEVGYRRFPTRNAFLHQHMGMNNYQQPKRAVGVEDFSDLMQRRTELMQYQEDMSQERNLLNSTWPAPDAAQSTEYRRPSYGM